MSTTYFGGSYNVFLVYVLGFLEVAVHVDAALTWHELGGVCYGLSDDRRNYATSVTMCRNVKSEIVQVYTYEVHTFLGSILNATNDYWVGLQLQGLEFVWNDGSKPSSNMWVPEEPNLTGENVRYTLYYDFERIESPIHQLADNPGTTSYNYICMKQTEDTEWNRFGKRVSADDAKLYKIIDISKKRSSVECATHCASTKNCNVIGYKKDYNICTIHKWTGSDVSPGNMTGYKFFHIRRPCI